MEKKHYANVVLEEVRRLKKQYPDAIYCPVEGTCYFTKGMVKNGPKTHGCVTGQAIRNVYPDLFKRLKKDEKDYLSGAAHLIGGKTKLSNILSQQDNGIPWGKCKEQL